MLRTYSAVFVYDRPGHEVARADLPGQQQGESIAADGDRLLVGSEGVHSQVLAVPVPGGAGTPSPAPSSTPPGASTPASQPGRRADDPAGPPHPAAYAAVGGLALLGVLAAVAVSRRRRRSRGS